MAHDFHADVLLSRWWKHVLSNIICFLEWFENGDPLPHWSLLLPTINLYMYGVLAVELAFGAEPRPTTHPSQPTAQASGHPSTRIAQQP